MDKYTFFDTNFFGDCNEDFDIAGEDYEKFLKTCFKYSSTFAFMVDGLNKKFIQANLPPELEKFRIPLDACVLDASKHYWFKLKKKEFADSIFCYRVCPELFPIVLNITDSIFKWIDGWGYKNPEDPAFFREDGSIFFNSTIHEGECYLYPRPDEDVSDILSIETWYKNVKTVIEDPITKEKYESD